MKSWSDVENVLCIRLDAMGDLLMTTPALKFLKEKREGRRLTLLTSSEGAKIAPLIGIFDEVIIYKAPWLKSSQQKDNAADDLFMIKKLSMLKFDGAIIFTVYSQSSLPSALLCYLSKIPLRAAYARENPYSLLTNWLKETEPQKNIRHEVRRHLDLVSELLNCPAPDSPLVLQTNPLDRKKVENILDQKLSKKRDLKKCILIHPGSSALSRRYNVQGFSELADSLIKDDLTVIFSGSKDEIHLIKSIQRGMKASNKGIDLSGLLTLGEFIALVSLTCILISNNTGPVHIAAALGTPVVNIYALTNPQHTPWMVKHSLLFQKVDCAFCYKSICPREHQNCINLISPQRIFNETKKIMSSNQTSKRDLLAVNPIFFEEKYKYDYS